jgi:hypothetical protein
MNLSTDEQALLEKLGIKLSDLDKAIKKQVQSKVPEEVNLSQHSAIVILHCKCCGHTDKTFADYVKRVDAPGFVLKTVLVASHPITRTHESSTFICSNCQIDNLTEFKKADLIVMICNLRNELKKGVRK